MHQLRLAPVRQLRPADHPHGVEDVLEVVALACVDHVHDAVAPQLLHAEPARGEHAERRLEGREYILDEYSIADMASWPWVLIAKPLGQPLDDFPKQLEELFAYLDNRATNHLRVVQFTAPDVYLLGSSGQSAVWAAELGLPYVFADFISPNGVELARFYRDNFIAFEGRLARWAYVVRSLMLLGISVGFAAAGYAIARTTIAVTLMNACTLFGWWGLNSWIPAYLSLPAAQGGIGLSTGTMSNLVLTMQVGMWLGYVTFGYIGDAIGRKRAYVLYLLCASVLLPTYGALHHPSVLLALGPLVAFFGTGYYSGFGAVTAELYPTRYRATAQGFTYNLGRIASAAAPFTVGSLAATQGFAIAFAITGAAFLLASLAWIWIPETQGRALA